MILLSNVEFEELYKQFSLMIKSFIKKYRRLLEEDEIHQCCCIAIMKAYNTYEDNRNTKFSNWVYSCMQWQILKELSKENKHKDVISINSEITSVEGSTAELIEVIADDTDYFQRVEDAIMVQTYKEEAKRVLPKNKYDICALRWFHNYSYEAIEKVLGCKSISNTLMQSRIELIKKSKLFRSEYNKFHNINDYSEVSRLVF